MLDHLCLRIFLLPFRKMMLGLTWNKDKTQSAVAESILSASLDISLGLSYCVYSFGQVPRSSADEMNYHGKHM